FAAVYGALFAVYGMSGGGYGSIEAVQRLMAVPGLLTAGWLHYLAFDLFVGAWIAERAGVLGLPHLLVLPLLALTFLFGPLGWLAFAAVRLLWLRRHPQPVLA
ncbi:MAG: abscisic acid-deficient protein Aba4 family protein, partial [Rhizobacter sp.]